MDVYEAREQQLRQIREQQLNATSEEEVARTREFDKSIARVRSFGDMMEANGVPMSENVEIGKPWTAWGAYVTRKQMVDELWKKAPGGNLEVALREERRVRTILGPPLQTPFTSDPMAEALGANDINPMWQRYNSGSVRGPR